ncbi:hypothetical protein BC830DRAFT_1094971 [Chytriomyces sp. MP71]|nr:hypothetical protein BC830DRAFT_1094971 [Chytriomyces sp. MP71]
MPAVVPAIPEPIIPGSYTPRPRTGEAVQQQQQQYPVTAVQQRPRAAVNGPQEQVPPIHRVNTAPTVNSQVQYRSQEPIRDFKESVAPLKSIEDSRGRARLPAQSSSFAVPPPPVDDPRNGGRIMAPQDKLSFQEDSRGRGRQGPESFQDRDRSVAPAGRIPFDSSRNQSVAPMGRVPMQQQPTLRDMSPATHGATDGYRSRAR